MRLLLSRLNKRIISIICLCIMGLSGFVQPTAGETAQFFNDQEVICPEAVNLGFSSQVQLFGNTVRIDYKSLKGLPDQNQPRPSVLATNVILSRTFRVEMTYLEDEKSRANARDYYSKTNLSDLYTLDNQDSMIENITTDDRKSVIISKASTENQIYRFRRDIIYGDYAAVVKIQSAGLDSRCIDMPASEFIDLIENHAAKLMAAKGITAGQTAAAPESDNIELATEDLNLAAAFLNKRRAEGSSDLEIARLVNFIVSERLQVINNFVPETWYDWSNPMAFILNYFAGSFEDSFGKWRDMACFNYDTNAIWAWNNRIGQCEDTAQLSYYLLKNAGIKCNLYAVEGHAFVIINADQARIQDSREWNENVAVVDPWQNKVLTGREAYENKYVFNRGEKEAVNTTQLYDVPQGYEDIKSRNIVWDQEAKTWKPRPGYKFKYLSGAWMGYCVPE